MDISLVAMLNRSRQSRPYSGPLLGSSWSAYTLFLVVVGCGGGRSSSWTPVEREERAPEAAAAQGPAKDCQGEAEVELVEAINSIRAASGGRPLACYVSLHRAAANHAAYLRANAATLHGSGFDRHAEDPRLPYFTGESPGARAAHVGIPRAAFWVSENVGGFGEPKSLASSHVATVYHRSPLLTPAGRYIAYSQGAMDDDRPRQHVIASLADGTLRSVRALAPSLHPGRGERSVPASFGPARETPDPVPELRTPGYPISIHFPRYVEMIGGEVEEPMLVVTRFELSHSAGTIVPSRVLTAARDPLVAGSDVFLVPLEPLGLGTTFTVIAEVAYGRFSLSETWTFETAYSHSGPIASSEE